MAIKSDPVVPVKEEGDEKTIKIRSVAAEFNRLTLFANPKTDTAPLTFATKYSILFVLAY